MKILVCGSRNFKDRNLIWSHLDFYRPSLIIHGMAQGADSLANDYALKWGIATIVFPAEWDKYGRSAGPIRNKIMLDASKPDIVLAFPLSGSRGTNNMINLAKEAGYEVIIQL